MTMKGAQWHSRYVDLMLAVLTIITIFMAHAYAYAYSHDYAYDYASDEHLQKSNAMLVALYGTHVV